MELDPFRLLVSMLLAALYVVLLMGGLWLTYFFLTLPLRRSERARLFLDVLELGMKQGQTPETAIVAAASSLDRSFGSRFYGLAEHITQGRSLAEALDAVPHLLSPEVQGMLHAGERMGNLGLVIPACRKMLHDSVSQINGALNYLLLLTFVFSPVVIVIPLVLRLNVMPKYIQVFEGFGSGPLPAFTSLVFGSMNLLTLILFLIILFIWTLTFAYVAGPRLRKLLRRSAPGLVDRCLYLIPWRRKRMHRNFSHLLALLLDTGTPENEAVQLSAQATGNDYLRSRASAILDALSRGIPLPEALASMDASGQFGWRLKNAFRSGGGFTKVLEGWHEHLDAKAEQQEQAAAQSATTALVLINGVVVGSTVIAVFLVLVAILQEATLW